MPESPATILVVDDREENRYISSRILKGGGYAVIEASSGREALKKAVALDPALIILDVRLPDIVGYEVCRRLKANPQTANLPVLLISAVFSSSESRVQALESGADAYLTQPIEPTVLIATVRALLRLSNAEAFSRLSAKQWQSTFDALTEGVALIDNDWKIVRCNRAMTKLLKKRYGAIEKHDARALLKSEMGLEFEALEHIERETQRGRRWFSIRVEIISDHESRRGAILIITEITDRKLAEEALRFAERLAAMGRLANSIAHEINNPLEAITNLLYLLNAGKHDEQTIQYIEMASSELERVSRITKQTLAFNRESDQPIYTSIAEIVDGVVTLYSPQFNQKRIKVERRYEASPEIQILPGELRQVLSNLIRNAIEATPLDGRLTVYVHPSKDWKDLSRAGVRISLLDSGTGIPETVKARLFEPFFTTKQLKGSGLGLWLSLGIISKHQGRIQVRSSTADGRSGTCFSIFLPLQRTEEQKAPLSRTPQSAKPGERAGSSTSRVLSEAN